jgi:integrase
MSNNPLKDLIKSKGLKIGALAKEADIPQSFMSQIVTGRRKPTEAVLKVLNRHDLIRSQIKPDSEPVKEKKSSDVKLPTNVYEVFVEFKKAEPVSDSALNNYDKSIGKFLGLDKKTRRLNQAERIYSTGEKIIEYLKQFKGNQYGYANRHFHWRNLRTFYKWLYDKYDYPNPIVNSKGKYLVPEPFVDKESVQPSITKEEMTSLLKSDELNPRDKLLLALPYFSSMRLNEWSGLRYEDINFKAGMVNEVKTKGRHITSKTVVKAIPYIKAYLDETGISSGKLFQGSSKYKALSPRGIEDRLKTNIQPMARKITGNHKLSLTPHVLRRGFARLMQESKVPDTVGMQLGGWKSQKMYKKYGNSLNMEDASRIANDAIKDAFSFLNDYPVGGIKPI